MKKSIILTIIVVIAIVSTPFFLLIGSTLIALGVTNPATWTDDFAMGFDDIGSPESGAWKISENPASDQFQLKLTISKHYRDRIDIKDITISIDGERCTTTSGTGIAKADSIITIEANCGYKVAGSSYRADIEITYDQLNTGLAGFKETGTLMGTVS